MAQLTPTQTQKMAGYLDNPPQNFTVTQTVEGYPLLQHHDEGKGYLILYLLIVLLVCGLVMVNDPSNAGLFLLMFLILPALVGLYLLLFHRRQYELQPKQLIVHVLYPFGMWWATAIPKTSIKAIRVIYEKGGGEESSTWALQLTWGSDQISRFLARQATATSVRWLGMVLATWAELALIWENPADSAQLYQRGIALAPEEPARPHLRAVEFNRGRQVGYILLVLVLLASMLFIPLIISGLLGVLICWLLTKLIKQLRFELSFRAKARTTQAIITQRWIEYASDPSDDQSYLAYQFPAGAETGANVKQARYAVYRVGDAVRVRYLPTDLTLSRPEWQ